MSKGSIKPRKRRKMAIERERKRAGERGRGRENERSIRANLGGKGEREAENDET